MKVLTIVSVVSVLCAVSVWLFVVPQLVGTGMVEPGPLLGLMVLLPTPVGLIAALVGRVAGLWFDGVGVADTAGVVDVGAGCGRIGPDLGHGESP
ncbi:MULTISPECIES: hypothetical protein [Rhodococcus]|uniref:hypothetical protein n=1 Tax=Rhodococcus TaxID=1827 RepID=UPI00042EC0E0|nr:MULTISPECIES: hypothetical protein [Rhodococcus]AHK30820.1 hypothetical protein Pd630_LPD03607 [Rhodococcus opacus PD630]